MQLKTLFLLFLLSIFFTASSCKRLEEPPPISINKMKSVLLDLQLAETYSVGLNYDTLSPADRFKKNFDSLSIYYASVLNHYNLSNEEFKEAMKWYERNPPLMDSLISMTIEQLTEEQAKLNIKEYEPKDNNERINPKLIKRQLLLNTDKMQSNMDSLNKIKQGENTKNLKEN